MQEIKIAVQKALNNEISHEQLINIAEELLFTDRTQQSINEQLSKQNRALLEDMSAQWDLYLANTYTIEELQKLSLQQVRLPESWLRRWYESND
ncbi:hypothetical protein [Listeria newyorkensis]|uniref:Uncharacterized protein n=1 Tax=Listeria newyorkensis TaxID=1497681 RepID=A0A841YX42_9LIST|nr:hypothetical protein [Listeria newyorkensis]MBC1457868.1 hypothetical protein [Listeria newyorkensis]